VTVDVKGVGPSSPAEGKNRQPAHEQGQGGEHEGSAQNGTGAQLGPGLSGHEQYRYKGNDGLRESGPDSGQHAADAAF